MANMPNTYVADKKAEREGKLSEGSINSSSVVIGELLPSSVYPEGANIYCNSRSKEFCSNCHIRMKTEAGCSQAEI